MEEGKGEGRKIGRGGSGGTLPRRDPYGNSIAVANRSLDRSLASR